MSSRLLSSSLVTVSSLKNLLKTNDATAFNKTYRILDANLGTGANVVYNSGHIENALYFDSMNCVKPSELYPRNLPNKECFRDYVGSMGISNKHHLIVYDRSPFGFYVAPRLWWLFRYFGHEKISVLNGGLNKWNFEGGTLSTDTPKFREEKFELKENKSLIRNFGQITDNLDTKKELVIDVRGADVFNAFNEKGRSGHIKNSKNLPYNDLFDAKTGQLKDEKQLAAMISKLTSNNKNQPIVASCLTGMTASTLAFSLDLLGYKNVSLYYGSWTEYSQRASEDQCEIDKK